MSSTLVTLCATSVFLCSCATAALPEAAANVRIYNIHGSGSETLPREIDGCKSLGSVSATAAEYRSGGLPRSPGGDRHVAVFDPQPVLQTIRARAARKAADTVIVSFNPGFGEWRRRTLPARAFRCGSHPLPSSFGKPIP